MYTILAVYLFFVTIFGILVNGAIIYLYFSRKEIATTSNMYVVALCICGFLIAILGVPFAAASSIRHEWLFGDGLCKVHGFLLTGLGIVMIAILTGIAIDKYIFIVQYQSHHKVTKSVTLAIIIVCFVYGVTWGILPLFGWNKYVLEPARLTCSVDWTGDIANHSYVITILFTGLIIPVSIIAYLYTSILKRVHSQRIISQRIVSHSRKIKIVKREKKIAMTLFMMVASFVLAWLPYSIYGLICILGYSDDIPLVWHTVPSAFAKASILWNPVIYSSRSNAMKRALGETYPFLRWMIPKNKSQQKLPGQTTLVQMNTSNGSDAIFVQSLCDNRVTSTSL
ncbi:melanopsin-B-like [Saccostrea cucullata]|uniref:melanopsin-B-like n=1 Tax=Saccostrea cuccullata TaxID=36930 RepID=UPI002ED02188